MSASSPVNSARRSREACQDHGAHRAGELEGEDALCALVQPVDAALQLVGPDGGLIAKGDGQGLDVVGAAHHGGIGMALAQVQHGGLDAHQLGAGQGKHAAQGQSHGGVHDILGGGAQMDVLAALRSRRRLQQAEHGDHGVSGLGVKFVIAVQGQLLHMGGLGDIPRRLRGDDAQRALGVCQGGLHLQPAGEAPVPGKKVGDLG